MTVRTKHAKNNAHSQQTAKLDSGASVLSNFQKKQKKNYETLLGVAEEIG